jgi:hypothetical protein
MAGDAPRVDSSGTAPAGHEDSIDGPAGHPDHLAGNADRHRSRCPPTGRIATPAAPRPERPGSLSPPTTERSTSAGPPPPGPTSSSRSGAGSPPAPLPRSRRQRVLEPPTSNYVARLGAVVDVAAGRARVGCNQGSGTPGRRRRSSRDGSEGHGRRQCVRAPDPSRLPRHRLSLQGRPGRLHPPHRLCCERGSNERGAARPTSLT